MREESRVTEWIRRSPLVAYFVITYAISWAIAIPLAARALGWLALPLPFALHYLIPFGPMLAAIIVTRTTKGPDGLRELYGRMTRWQVGAGWILLAILAPVLVFAVAAFIAPLFGAVPTDFRDLGSVNFMPYLGAGAWLLWFVTFGIGEETGWRGFALPRLQANRSALAATLILSIPWAVWHVPSLLYLGNLRSLGIMLPGFFIGLILGGIVYTWLFNSTGGSVLMVALLHASMNFVTASRAGQGAMAAIVSTAFMVWGILVVILFKPANLARSERPVAPGARTVRPSSPRAA
jgi:membrane protease YdiL (CAAX protease family)